MSLDTANLKEMQPERRYTLIAALLHQMRVRARDDLAEMFIRRMGAIHKRAKEELALIQARQREQMETAAAGHAGSQLPRGDTLGGNRRYRARSPLP